MQQPLYQLVLGVVDVNDLGDVLATDWTAVVTTDE